MGYKKISVLPPKEGGRRERTRATGASAVTYMNRYKLREPLEKPANRKKLEASAARTAAYRAYRAKRQRAHGNNG